MIAAVPFACFLSLIRPPGIKFEDSLLQLAPVDKVKCPFVKNGRDMRFQLYTRYNPVQPQELLLGDDERLFASHINFNEPTVIYFHAFMEEPQDGSGVYIREAYILRGDTNVIMVDAQTLEAGPWYFRAAENTWFIGQFAAQFIDYLVSRGLDLSNTHLIGHSLGAQSAGVAGSATKSGRVSRITGLDPAFPLFDKLPLEQRLDPTDAKFVDVIHTDAGIFGFPGQVGHADFFPNGGISPQPGCEIKTVLPQQQLLNKCNVAHMHSYYAFHLAPNTETSRRYHLRKDLEALYSLIENIKNNSKGNIPNDIKKAKIVKKSTEKKDKKTHNKVNKSTAESNIKVNYNKLYYNNDNYTKNDNTVITKDIENISALKSIVYGTFIVQNIDTKSDIIDTSDKAPNTEDITLETNDNVDIDINGTPLEKKSDKNDKVVLNDTATELQEKTPEKNYNSDTQTTRTRSKRFINPFRQSETAENNNFVQNMLGFLLRHRKSVIPVITVMREISTLVKTANGELNHNTKERNNYIGAAPPALNPVTYNLELDGESKLTAFVKRLLGLKTKGDRLTITGTGK